MHQGGGRRRLQAARKASCTQVIRASYLSTGQKMMATIGVLNLANVTAAEQAGRETGADRVHPPAARREGATRNLTKGTGLEEAEIKGHYLILTWAEFTNLQAPRPGGERPGAGRVLPRHWFGQHTANISLTSRMVSGKPRVP